MFRLIEKLQKQPEHVRKNIALFIAILIIVPIFFLWVSTLSFYFSPSALLEENRDSVSASWLSEIGGDLNSFYGELKAEVGALGRIEIDLEE